MPFFSYKALNSDGEIIKGTIEEKDIDLAYNSISSSGLYILNIRKSANIVNFYINKLGVRRVKTRDIIEFANNLSVMLRGGIPLLTSLKDVSETMENRYFKKRIEDIKNMVELGSGFATALSMHHDIFPAIFINLVAVGEETGRLDVSLSEIVVHLQRMEDLKNAIKRALIYPVFAIIATTGALLFWLIYVLPKIIDLFVTMAVKLPLITRIIIAASNFSRSYWFLLLLTPVFIYIALKLMARYDTTKYYIDAAKLKLPIVKLITYNKLLALFSEQLRILFSSGLQIDKIFDIMIKLMNNLVYRNAITEIKKDILQGSRMHEAVKKHSDLFPSLVTRLIFVGEETGNLNEQLDYLSQEFIKRLNDVSQKMEKMIEPIVIIVIGGIFLVIIAGLLLPIYDLVSTMGTR